MLTATPEAFADIAEADRIIIVNRKAVEACRKTASRTRKKMSWTIGVKADPTRRCAVSRLNL